MTHAGLYTSLVQPTVDVRALLEELERVGLTAYDAHLDWVASAVMHLAGIIRAKTEALTAERPQVT